MNGKTLSTLFGRLFHYRKEPVQATDLAHLLAERKSKSERASEVQFLIAREREETSSSFLDPETLDRLRRHTLELIDLTERLAEIDSQPLQREAEDIFPDMKDCFEKMHLIRLCRKLREESIEYHDKAIEAEVAWQGLQAHIKLHGC